MAKIAQCSLKPNKMKVEDYYKNFLNDNYCEKRSNPVSIKWNILDNSVLENTGLVPESMENWSDMFTVVNGHLKEDYYISDLLYILFNVRDNTKASDRIRDNKRNLQNKLGGILDLNMDTIIFTPSGKEAQFLLKNLVEDVLGSNYDVMVMNGGTDTEDGTTNAKCEKEATELSENAHKHGRKCVFITCTMGTRSWSNKYVKNAILMFNDGSFDMVQQKIARTFTPFEDPKHNISHIVDFRLSYSHDTCKANIYIVGNVMDNMEHNCGEGNLEVYVDEMLSTNKIEFIEAYSNTTPIKPLSKEQIISMLETRSFINQNVDLMIGDIINIDYELDEKYFIREFKETNKMKSTNVKGDRGMAGHLAKNGKRKGKTEKVDLDNDQRVKYARFIFTNGQLFNVNNYTDNVLKNIIKKFNNKENIDYIENELGLDSGLVYEILQVINKKFTSVLTNKYFNYVN